MNVNVACGCCAWCVVGLLAGLPDLALAVTDPADIAAPLKAEPGVKWEGAVGGIVGYRPEYPGAARMVSKVTPALFLRYGRFSITNASGFVTRRADDVTRGLGVELVQSSQLRVNLALRVDRGRSESTSQDLAGLGDIKPTVRARVAASWQIGGPWSLAASWNVDALGRGGGNYGDVGLGWTQRLSPSTTMGAGASLSLAGDRYMQTVYGVSAAQAQRTTYPVYEPGSGLRDLAVVLYGRHDLSRDWVLIGGVGASRLLGPAAASPLSKSVGGWSSNIGLARRF